MKWFGKYNIVLILVILFLVLGMIPSRLFDQRFNSFVSTATDSSTHRDCAELISGGPVKDGIPALDNPKFITVTEFEDRFDEGYLRDIFVMGTVVNGQPRAYPLDILTWHEVVNDKFDKESFSVTYCPLTGSGIAFDTFSIQNSTLGVTGKLIENNLVFYDRISDTYWSQMLGFAWCGPLKGSLPMVPLIESSWEKWKEFYPNTLVLSRDTGYSRSYDRNPYGPYSDIDTILFPSGYQVTNPFDNYFHSKTFVYILSTDNVKTIFPFPELASDKVLNFEINNQNYVIYSEGRTVVAFSAEVNENTLNFKKIESTSDPTTILEDETGSLWNIWGEAVEGPMKGENLDQIAGYNAYWFSAVVFFRDANFYINNSFITYDFPLIPKAVQAQNTPSYTFEISFLSLLIVLIITRKRLEKN
ncbi:MAG: DUF3179 domain-containing protein [Candidatus Hodarchaeales archaeon]|jgi:hypothetical protein